MNSSGVKAFVKAHTFDQELIKELFEYGYYEADAEIENDFGSFRMSVIRHDKTKQLYWIRQWNGEVTEFRNIT